MYPIFFNEVLMYNKLEKYIKIPKEISLTRDILKDILRDILITNNILIVGVVNDKKKPFLCLET